MSYFEVSDYGPDVADRDWHGRFQAETHGDAAVAYGYSLDEEGEFERYKNGFECWVRGIEQDESERHFEVNVDWLPWFWVAEVAS